MLEERIVEVKRKLIAYSAFVQVMIEKSIRGLLEKEKALLLEVVEKDEPQANSYEMELDDLCAYTIAKFQPRARDLRTILVGLRMSNDLERMADHAVNIAESGLFLVERPAVKELIDIPRMAQEATGMVRDALLSFLNEDAKLAREVCRRDSVVDGLKDQVLRELITYMSADPGTIERSMNLLTIANNLERIADFSTNISEDVIFMVEGRIIKHHRENDNA
jgi:phosphate transport system protein